jgi:hypothetical protein
MLIVIDLNNLLNNMVDIKVVNQQDARVLEKIFIIT